MIENIVSQLPWDKSVGKRPLRQIRYAALHHDAIATTKPYEALKRYQSEAQYHINKGFGHLGYHYKISSAGQVYLCVPEEEIGYHAGNWTVNRDGLGICLDGDFSKHPPTEAQLDALEELIVHLATKRPDMPLLVKRSFYAHKEVRFLPTFCPGPQLTQLVKNYRY